MVERMNPDVKAKAEVDWSQYPIRDVETIASRLEDVARRLRRIAANFADDTQKPDSVLEDVIAAYIQYTGNNASYLGSLVRDVEHLRNAREKSRVAALESAVEAVANERDAARADLAEAQQSVVNLIEVTR
jgi:hypothetical protein